ncbi:GNAT family N-acetyltransferase [Cryptosporangium phraense]|uniref:GNAT family N-acetyltransferase n=1 Tax=Cryptosporangium phraense TaxID=2593070 RepID=UPI00197AAFC7|nr:GNAT family N-acetyltransferase [Cryptosporangium phraense]
MDTVELTAGRFLLRPCRPVDAEWVCRACQDPDIQRWTRVPAPYRLDDAVGYVTDHVPQSWATGRGAPFGVFDALTGEGLATVGLVSMDLTEGLAEVGYWVAPWARRRGIATAGTLAVARWAFGSLGVSRLTWLAEVGNTGSRAVAERAGFTIEGVLRDRVRVRDGSRADAWIGSLLPSDLKS